MYICLMWNMIFLVLTIGHQRKIEQWLYGIYDELNYIFAHGFIYVITLAQLCNTDDAFTCSRV